MKLSILSFFALPQAVLGTDATLTVYGVPNCPSSYAPSLADWSVFGVSAPSNPIIFVEGQCTLANYGDDWANYQVATCVGNGDIIVTQYRDNACTVPDLDNGEVVSLTHSDGVCENWGSGSGMWSCLDDTPVCEEANYQEGYTEFQCKYCRGPNWDSCEWLPHLTTVDGCRAACDDSEDCVAFDINTHVGGEYGCCLHPVVFDEDGLSDFPWDGSCWVKASDDCTPGWGAIECLNDGTIMYAEGCSSCDDCDLFDATWYWGGRATCDAATNTWYYDEDNDGDIDDEGQFDECWYVDDECVTSTLHPTYRPTLASGDDESSGGQPEPEPERESKGGNGVAAASAGFIALYVVVGVAALAGIAFGAYWFMRAKGGAAEPPMIEVQEMAPAPVPRKDQFYAAAVPVASAPPTMPPPPPEPAQERPSMLSKLASWRAPAAEAPTGRNLFCTACGAPVQGPFCGGCGTRAA